MRNGDDDRDRDRDRDHGNDGHHNTTTATTDTYGSLQSVGGRQRETADRVWEWWHVLSKGGGVGGGRGEETEGEGKGTTETTGRVAECHQPHTSHTNSTHPTHTQTSHTFRTIFILIKQPFDLSKRVRSSQHRRLPGPARTLVLVVVVRAVIRWR